MTIYTMCVDPERGAYMAISCDNPDDKIICGTSEQEALGRFVESHPGVTVDKVVSVDTSWK